jgi:hypothetical protein
MIGVDIDANGDIPIISVAKYNGSRIEHVNTIVGGDAILLYELLLKKPVGFKNE